MIVTTQMILGELKKEYKNPKSKLGRLVEEGKYVPIIRGLYETDPHTPGYLLSSFYSPSYLSFEYALSRHGLIPEWVRAYTLATYGKNRSKEYDTPFGVYYCFDVPKRVFGIGVEMLREGDYQYWMAGPEKALCDKLYDIKPIENKRYIENLLFDDLRIDEDGLEKMDRDLIMKLSEHYHCRNVSFFCDYMTEGWK